MAVRMCFFFPLQGVLHAAGKRLISCMIFQLHLCHLADILIQSDLLIDY